MRVLVQGARQALPARSMGAFSLLRRFRLALCRLLQHSAAAPLPGLQVRFTEAVILHRRRLEMLLPRSGVVLHRTLGGGQAGVQVDELRASGAHALPHGLPDAVHGRRPQP
jgi:hypothetical protein